MPARLRPQQNASRWSRLMLKTRQHHTTIGAISPRGVRHQRGPAPQPRPPHHAPPHHALHQFCLRRRRRLLFRCVHESTAWLVSYYQLRGPMDRSADQSINIYVPTTDGPPDQSTQQQHDEGMNLVNGLESHPEAFRNVVQGSCALAASLFLTSFALVRCAPCISLALASLMDQDGGLWTRHDSLVNHNYVINSLIVQGPGQGPHAAGLELGAGLPVHLQAHSLRLPGTWIDRSTYCFLASIHTRRMTHSPSTIDP